MRYIIGLDVGIGSVGWAAIQYDEPRKILDFGVRAFDSGENKKKKSSNCQIRRTYRGVRRLERRRRQRKADLQSFLVKTGFITPEEIKAYYKAGSNQPLVLRVKGLDEQLSPAEVFACLVHMCNHRGYRDFYELDDAEMTPEEREEYMAERQGAEVVNRLIEEGEYRSVAEMLMFDPMFNGTGEFRAYRNRSSRTERIQIDRRYLQVECRAILQKQQEFYPELSDANIDVIVGTVFRQRCFEDGPGKADDPNRKYTGFRDTIGECQFIPGELRASRFSVLADIYALVNELSQFKYFGADSQESFPQELATELVDFALTTGNISVKDVKAIAKKHGITAEIASGKSTLSSALKFIRPVKRVFDECGMDWAEAISEDYRDMNSLLNRIGVCMEFNQTPSRRVVALGQISELSNEAAVKLSLQKFSGTSRVCEKYMVAAVNAFLGGQRYGEYQAEVVKQNDAMNVFGRTKHYKLPSFEADKESFEFYKNRVVCRAINETRKIINALIERYGSPYAINIEVGRDLGHSFKERDKMAQENRANEKARQEHREAIAALLGIGEAEVTARQLEYYRLGENQGWVCLYSGEEIDKVRCLDSRYRDYEVDHIFPYSLILDDTINNKALVLTRENQVKGQRTPLMYMSDEQAKAFRKRVQKLYKDKKKQMSDRKFGYLMQPSLHGELAEEWKSRNLNDTRYISKFLVRYLRENLQFNHDEDEENYRRTEVYAIKGALTSQLRRLWLNDATWGRPRKDELKAVTLLDHAVDAIVIACAIPAYVEIASVQTRLNRIYRRENKQRTEEFMYTMNNCIQSMKIFYGIPETETRALLLRRDRTPCLINNLSEEVDIRLIEPVTFRYFGGEEQPKPGIRKKKGATDDSISGISDAEIYALHAKKCLEFYSYDKEFAANLRPPVVSHKPAQKFSGTITKDNPLSIREVDGEEKQAVRTSILAVKKKQLPIMCGNKVLVEKLTALLAPHSDETTVQDAMKAAGIDSIIGSNGHKVNRVTLLKTPKGQQQEKVIADDNRTILDTTNYFCLELYRTKKGTVSLTGLMFADIKKSGGKIWLAPEYQHPDDYAEHIMYLQKWDYITIFDKNGEERFTGYFVSCAGIKQNRVYYAPSTVAPDNKNMTIGISANDTVVKHSVDILGQVGGIMRGDRAFVKKA